MRNVGFHANFKVINNFQTSARGSWRPMSCFAFREFLAIKSPLRYHAGEDKMWPGCFCFAMELGQKNMCEGGLLLTKKACSQQMGAFPDDRVAKA